jgi:mannose-6-phosphate isomerase-like protein (cupin superfamily)
MAYYQRSFPAPAPVGFVAPPAPSNVAVPLGSIPVGLGRTFSNDPYTGAATGVENVPHGTQGDLIRGGRAIQPGNIVSADYLALARQNLCYYDIISTTPQAQLALRAIMPGRETGSEVHPSSTQFMVIAAGEGVLSMDDGVEIKNIDLRQGVGAFIAAGVSRNISNPSSVPLQYYTVYAPPTHDHASSECQQATAVGGQGAPGTLYREIEYDFVPARGSSPGRRVIG